MLGNLLVLLAAASAFADADPWQKVREVRSGAELRIYKKGVSQPILARMDELGEESLLVVVKNEQVAILKSDIDRIDARPPQTSSRVKQENKVTKDDPVTDGKPHRPPTAPMGQNTTYSSGVSIGSKPDFETVYRRSTPPPRK